MYTITDVQVGKQLITVVKMELGDDHPGLPPVIKKLRRDLKVHYRAKNRASLDRRLRTSPGPHDDPDVRVGICFMDANDLDDLKGCPGQKHPFVMSNAQEKASQLIELKDVLEEDTDRQLILGIAGSGKTTAFTEMAAFEWAKEGSEFWQRVVLFFQCHMGQSKNWDRESLSELFGLARFGFNDEEEDLVLRYIRSHSEKILLVIDALDLVEEVTIHSLMWQVLSGNCPDLPRMRLLIVSRTCEKAMWIAKHCLLHRRLEVVGFTDEKLDEFVSEYFRENPRRGVELQEKLSECPEVHSLMHTPLLAATLCRHFQMNATLPVTRTSLYQMAVLAMLRQTAGQKGAESPCGELSSLCPRAVQEPVHSLGRLACRALLGEEELIKMSDIEAAGCVEAPLRLGFLNFSPCVNIPGRVTDMLVFQHRPMLDFFAAMYVGMEIGQSGQGLYDFVRHVGVAGNLPRMWLFFSGLLKGSERETFLGVLAKIVNELEDDDDAELSKYFLLLLHCNAERSEELPLGRSPSVALAMESAGLPLRGVRLDGGAAEALSATLRLYGDGVKEIAISGNDMGRETAHEVFAGLQMCTGVNSLFLHKVAPTAESATDVSASIHRNKESLERLAVQANDVTLPVLAPAIMHCHRLSELLIGDRSLSNASSHCIVDILQRHKRALKIFSLSGKIDDSGFAAITGCLQDMAEQLEVLSLMWTQLSVPMIRIVMAPLANLRELVLVGNPIGDQGLYEMTADLWRLQHLHTMIFIDVGLTWQAVMVLEDLLSGYKPDASVKCVVLEDKYSFMGEETGLVSTGAMPFVSRMSYHQPVCFLGYSVRNMVTFYRFEQCLRIMLFV